MARNVLEGTPTQPVPMSRSIWVNIDLSIQRVIIVFLMNVKNSLRLTRDGDRNDEYFTELESSRRAEYEVFRVSASA